MSNIKVVDVNEADKQEEITPIEEAKPEEETVNEVDEEIQEEVKEEVVEEDKTKTKPKASDMLIVILVVNLCHTKTLDKDRKTMRSRT